MSELVNKKVEKLDEKENFLKNELTIGQKLIPFVQCILRKVRHHEVMDGIAAHFIIEYLSEEGSRLRVMIFGVVWLHSSHQTSHYVRLVSGVFIEGENVLTAKHRVRFIVRCRSCLGVEIPWLPLTVIGPSLCPFDTLAI